MEMEPQVKEAVDKQREFIKTYLEGTGSLEGAGAAQTYIYDCTVSLAGMGGNYLAVDFKRNGARFALLLREPCFEGGFGAGIYTGWGRAIFNQPIENQIGQTCPFTIETISLVGTTNHVQITNFNNNFIGAISSSGIGIGGGVGCGRRHI
jgi:hypothetical protein